MRNTIHCRFWLRQKIYGPQTMGQGTLAHYQNYWTKSESDKKGNDDDEADFQIIFDYLPKISWYQAGIVFMTGYSNVAGGSLQLAQESFSIGHSL